MLGRPLKFESVEQLESAIAAYFLNCAEKGRPLTVTGLALALDTTRETLLDYQEKENYSDTIKRAKLTIQNYVEEYLFVGKNVAGAIFNLVNNYNWSNKSQTDVTTGGEKIQYNVINYGQDNNNPVSIPPEGLSTESTEVQSTIQDSSVSSSSGQVQDSSEPTGTTFTA